MPKATKSIFVIMPFVKVNGGARKEHTLTAFFENHIKRPIEAADELAYQYSVARSGESFNITKDIIRSLSAADIVIADISGVEPNSNVMYELGVRLAVSERPVILIKENIPGVDNPFDVFGYFTKGYDPLDYAPLEAHLIAKLARLESGEEVFDNEVLRLIREELRQQKPDITNVSPARQRELVLSGVRALGDQIATAFGPSGLFVQARGEAGTQRLLTRGVEIARGLPTANPFEAEGVKLMQAAAEELQGAVGDGSKLVVLASRAMLDAADSPKVLTGAQLADEVEAAGNRAIALLLVMARSASEVGWTAIARTAAKASELPVDFDALMTTRGAEGVIVVEDGNADVTTIEHQEHYRLDRGPSSDDFLLEDGGNRITLESPLTLVYAGDISSMGDLLPVLEIAAASRRSLLILAHKVEGDALATLLVNLEKQKLRCVPIGAPGSGALRASRLNDFAVLTGARLVDPNRGDRLDSTTLGDLGSAALVVVSRSWTEVRQGAGRPEQVKEHIARLRTLAAQATSEFERERLLERIAQLVGAHLTIVVGGASSERRSRNREQVLQALAATTAAMDDGVVCGGASALARVARALSEEDIAGSSADAQRIVSAGLRAPLLSLVRNAQGDSDAIVEQVTRDGSRLVYESTQNTCVDEIESGVAEPITVLVGAIRTAVGTTSRFLRTGVWRPSPTDE